LSLFLDLCYPTNQSVYLYVSTTLYFLKLHMTFFFFLEVHLTSFFLSEVLGLFL
jgi:hypothetical protein